MDSQTNYKTKQKSLIESCVAKTDGKHFSIDDVCMMLDNDNNHVGKTTVYRHLERLVDEGVLKKYTIDGKSGACYQYTSTECEHFHLKCTSCGRLIHAECSFLSRLTNHVMFEHGFKIDGSRTVLYGLCNECADIHTATSLPPRAHLCHHS